MRSSEQRATVEDLMYASVLEKFMNLKVEMLPRCVRWDAACHNCDARTVCTQTRERKRQDKTVSFSVSLMRSPVIYCMYHN